MAEDQEYDEVDAAVRIPKGERLADSRKTDGWSRGFTPKTSDKGPEHVEIRLKAEDESGFTGRPEIVYVTEYVEDQRPQLTPGQQARADIARQIIEGLVEIAKPLVAHWWHTQTVPFLVAKREALVLKQQAVPRSTSRSGAPTPGPRDSCSVRLVQQPCKMIFKRGHLRSSEALSMSSGTSESLQKKHRHTPPDLHKCESWRGVTDSLGLLWDFRGRL